MTTPRKAKRLADNRKKRISSLVLRVLSGETMFVTTGAAGGIVEGGLVFVPCHKVNYGHKATAEMAGVAMHQKTGDDFDAYYCRRCRAWHIGHARNRGEV